MKKVIWIFTIIAILLSGGTIKAESESYYENHIDWDQFCMRASNIIISKQEYKKLYMEGLLHQRLTDLSHITVRVGKPNTPFEQWSSYSGNIYLDLSQVPAYSKINDKVTVTILFYINRKDVTYNYVGSLLTIDPNLSAEDKPNKDKPNGDDKNPDSGESKPPKDTPTVSGKPENKDPIQKVEIPKDNQENNPILKPDKPSVVIKEQSFWDWLTSGKDIEVKIPFLNFIIHMTPFSITTSVFSILLFFLVFLVLLGDIRMLLKYRKDKEKYLCSRYRQ